MVPNPRATVPPVPIIFVGWKLGHQCNLNQASWLVEFLSWQPDFTSLSPYIYPPWFLHLKGYKKGYQKSKEFNIPSNKPSCSSSIFTPQSSTTTLFFNPQPTSISSLKAQALFQIQAKGIAYLGCSLF
jgi:hypothetical protein